MIGIHWGTFRVNHRYNNVSDDLAVHAKLTLFYGGVQVTTIEPLFEGKLLIIDASLTVIKQRSLQVNYWKVSWFLGGL